MVEARKSANHPGQDGYMDTGARPGQRVFISYASQDATIANRMCAALESADVLCWIAPRDVQPGESYAAAIVNAINSCRMLVLVLSKGAIESSHVMREVERASSKNRLILSVRLDTTVLPPDLEYFLSANHWLDASGGPVEQILPALVEAVRGRASKAAPPTDIPSAPHKPPGRASSRWLIGLAAAIGVAIAVYVADRFWLKKAVTTSPEAVVISGGAATDGAHVNERSIAVLPFADMSEKHDQEYFSDGMTEEIIDLLVKIPDLKVPARTSSFYFKGKSTQIPEIARQLGVTNVLEGSIRKSGNHLRVTAQLVRADNGFHVWSETYDRQLDDVFKTQDEIAGAVVKALKVSLATEGSPTAVPTTSSEAYELYLRARTLIVHGSEQETIDAYHDLRRAVTLDPKFALAWAGLADVLSRDNTNWTLAFGNNTKPAQANTIDLSDWGSVWGQAREDARSAAEQAIKFAPDLANSHVAKAEVLGLLDSNWTAAEAEIHRALELEPSNAAAIELAADYALSLGRFSESLKLAERALTLDPLGAAWGKIGWAHFSNGDLEEAARAFRREVELYPTASMAHFRYASVLLAQGNALAALAEYKLETLPGARDVGVAIAVDALGRRAEADRLMADAIKVWGNALAFQVTYLYAQRGDADQAFAWLDRAYRQRDGGMQDLKSEPRFKKLRQDPRYSQLMQKMNLPLN
jgi:adenylate cyclase